MAPAMARKVQLRPPPRSSKAQVFVVQDDAEREQPARERKPRAAARGQHERNHEDAGRRSELQEDDGAALVQGEAGRNDQADGAENPERVRIPERLDEQPALERMLSRPLDNAVAEPVERQRRRGTNDADEQCVDGSCLDDGEQRTEAAYVHERSLGFVEVEQLAPRCRFADCRHMREPACAVQAAVQAGTMHPRRYESYRRLRRLHEELSAARGPKKPR